MNKKRTLERREVFGSPPRYITVKGLSNMLGVSEKSIRNSIRRGTIPSRAITCIPWSFVAKLDLDYLTKALNLRLKK